MKSITGVIGILCGGAIFWLSRKQKCVSSPIAKAEHIAIAVTTKQGKWIAQVVLDMGYPKYVAKNVMIVQKRGDNQGAGHLVKNPILPDRSKYIDISYHYKRDLAEKKRNSTKYIPTQDMIAGGKLNLLPRLCFEKFLKDLGLGSRGKNDRSYWE